jgi:hypothetical protein
VIMIPTPTVLVKTREGGRRKLGDVLSPGRGSCSGCQWLWAKGLWNQNGVSYSYFRATTGSTRIARRAGTDAATMAQAARTRAAAPSIVGS